MISLKQEYSIITSYIQNIYGRYVNYVDEYQNTIGIEISCQI